MDMDMGTYHTAARRRAEKQGAENISGNYSGLAATRGRGSPEGYPPGLIREMHMWRG